MTELGRILVAETQFCPEGSFSEKFQSGFPGFPHPNVKLTERTNTSMPTNQISKTGEMYLIATLLVQQPLHLEELVPQIHPTHSPTRTEPRIPPQAPTLPLW